MIVDKINKYLSSENLTFNESLKYDVGTLAKCAFERQFMENSEGPNGKLRLSSAGKCARQLAYGYHHFEKKGKEVDSRSRIIFFQGDLVELMLTSLAKLAGCNIVATGLQQSRVFLPVNGTTIEGHPDGLLIQDGEIYLIEVKSMSSFSFERFQKGEVDEGYRAQINCYLAALGIKKCVLAGQNKDSGVLHELIIGIDDSIVKSCIANLESVLKSTPEKLPPPAYEKNEKNLYPWQCLYCAYWGHCRPNAEKVLVKQSYKLKEKSNETKNN